MGPLGKFGLSNKALIWYLVSALIVTLPLKNDELLFQVVCDDWDQDGLDDLIYVYRQQESVSSISVDLGSNGLKVPDQHYDLQH